MEWAYPLPTSDPDRLVPGKGRDFVLGMTGDPAGEVYYTVGRGPVSDYWIRWSQGQPKATNLLADVDIVAHSGSKSGGLALLCHRHPRATPILPNHHGLRLRFYEPSGTLLAISDRLSLDFESILELREAPDGAFIVGGSWAGGMAVHKIAPNGAVQWSSFTRVLPSGIEAFAALDVSETGECIVVGNGQAGEPGSMDVLALKLSASGEKLWSRRYDLTPLPLPPRVNIFNLYQDRPTSVRFTPHGGVLILAESARLSLAGHPQSEHAIILALDPLGIGVWTNRLAALAPFPASFSLAVRTDGSAIVCVTSMASNPGSPSAELYPKTFTSVFEADGTLRWTNRIEWINETSHVVLMRPTLQTDASGSIVLGGALWKRITGSDRQVDFGVAKISPTGELMWKRVLSNQLPEAAPIMELTLEKESFSLGSDGRARVLRQTYPDPQNGSDLELVILGPGGNIDSRETIVVSYPQQLYSGASDLARLPDGTLLALALVWRAQNAAGELAEPHWVLTRLSPNGDVLYRTASSPIQVVSVQYDNLHLATSADGRAYVITYENHSEPSRSGFRVTCVSSLGNLEWSRWVDSPSPMVNGSAKGRTSPDGSLIVATTADLQWLPEPGPEDPVANAVFLWKFSSSGDLIWSRELAPGVRRTRYVALATDAEGGFWAAASGVPPGADNESTWIYRYSSAGTPVWTNVYPFTLVHEEIVADSQSNCFITLISGTGKPSTRKLNAAGIEISASELDENDETNPEGTSIQRGVVLVLPSVLGVFIVPDPADRERLITEGRLQFSDDILRTLALYEVFAKVNGVPGMEPERPFLAIPNNGPGYMLGSVFGAATLIKCSFMGWIGRNHAGTQATFRVQPRKLYEILEAPQASGPWTKVADLWSSALGDLVYTLPNASAPSRFYRAQPKPAP